MAGLAGIYQLSEPQPCLSSRILGTYSISIVFLVFSDPLTVGVDFQTQKDPKMARSFPNPILTVWGTTLAFDAIRVMASAGMSGWR